MCWWGGNPVESIASKVTFGRVVTTGGVVSAVAAVLTTVTVKLAVATFP